MNKITPVDQKNRDRIKDELDVSFFVEAGAGSGKTRSLVGRMVGLISSGKAGIENVAAVTFTRKAAAELRERFQIKLESTMHDESVTSEEKQNIQRALGRLERAFIGTIHSFCAKLLRERPVEAGVDPGFEELEEAESAIYAEQVWSDYIEKLGAEGDSTIGWMMDNGIQTVDIKDIYLARVNYTDVEPVTTSVPLPDFGRDRERVREFLESLRKEMPDNRPEKGWGPLQKTILKGLRLIEEDVSCEERKFVSLLNLLNKKATVTQNRWSGKETAKSCEAAFLDFQEKVIVPALRKWGEYLHKPIMDFINGGCRYYECWREERGILNFQDLLMKTATLLRENVEVRRYFKRQITHLLVDEFQDTDPIQAEIIMLLAGEESTENRWRKVKPKPGSLFVVGDPKQSIYRFRRADIDIYNQVKRIFLSGAGEVLELTSNFRSLKPIGEFVDSVFQGVFPEDDTKYQAKFAPLHTTRKDNADFTSGIFENEIGQMKGNKAVDIAQQDAERIAVWIKKAIAGEIKLKRTDEEKNAGLSEVPVPGDFMIITRVKKRLVDYAHALERMGIPYEISGGESFGQSEELFEIFKVLKTASDPKDPVALIATLRGQLFGISDDELYKFKQGGGSFSYYSEPPEEFGLIKTSYERLKKYREFVGKYSAVTAAEKIIEDLGIIPLAVSREMGSTRAGNILKAIELLRKPPVDQTGSFSELVKNLNDFLEAKAAEEMSLFPGTAKAVRIMNLHKAKGLEAPVVFLVDPMGGFKEFEPDVHVSRTGEKSEGYFVLSKRTSEFTSERIAYPVGWDEKVAEEKLYEEAEDRRLEYVAATRAKNILVISTYKEGKTKKAWDILYPYLEGARQLKIKKEASDAKEREQFSISMTEWEKEKVAMETGLKELAAQSYHVTTATSMAKEDAVFTGGSAGGMAWGDIVHKSLEACGRGKRDSLEILAKNWLGEVGRSPEDIKILISLVDSIMKGEMWQRVNAAEEKYFEMPFAISEGDAVLTGVMDLIFKEGDGWVIVDYKTDDFDKYPERKTAYEKQLDIYAKYWEKITGEKVKEKLLCKVR